MAHLLQLDPDNKGRAYTVYTILYPYTSIIPDPTQRVFNVVLISQRSLAARYP